MTAPAPVADDELVRRAIRARGDRPFLGAVLHGAGAVLALFILAAGGDPLPLALAGGGLGSVAIVLGVRARDRRDGRSMPLRALLQEPQKVERITVVDEEDGLQVQIAASGVTDFVCPPGRLEDLIAMLRRRCPQAAFTDARR